MSRRDISAIGAFFAALAALIYPVTGALAAITLDSASGLTSTGKVSSLTWSHTVGSGSNSILIVGVAIRKNGVTVSSITYGGAGGFTLIGSQLDGGADHRTELYYKLAPTAGTANIIVTLSGAEGVVGGAVSFFGVDQTTPLGTFVGAQGTNANPTVTVTSATGEVVIDSVSANGDSGAVTVGGGQTQRWGGNSGTGDGDEYGAGSTEDGASSVTMSWTLTNANKWAIGAVPIKPAPTPTPGSGGSDGSSGGGTDSGGQHFTVIFSGQAYPRSQVEILYHTKDDTRFTSEIFQASADGAFYKTITLFRTEPYLFAIRARDADGREGGLLFFDQLVDSTHQFSSLLLAPTISVENTGNGVIKISGFAGGEDEVELELDSRSLTRVVADTGGKWEYSIPAASLVYGDHRVRARRVSGGQVSGYSPLETFRIASMQGARADLNDDQKIDIADWSIFLFRWGSTDQSLHSTIDLNNDGKVDTADFSIFLVSLHI